MRALDSKNTSVDMLEYWRLYYNFLRKHMALDGKTPAEMVGININKNNRWIELIKKTG